MSDEKRAREFWIPRDYSCDFHSGIHVIEFEAYDQLLQETERLADALEAMYNDTKSEHGIDEHDILPDSSSLGQSKVALESWSKFKETHAQAAAVTEQKG